MRRHNRRSGDGPLSAAAQLTSRRSPKSAIACVVGSAGLGLLQLSCAAADAGRPAQDGRPPTLGVSPFLPCDTGKAYEADAVLPNGARASDLVLKLGHARSAPEVGRSVNAEDADVSPPPSTSVSMSFQRAPGPVIYHEGCGPRTVRVPVLLNIELSSGAKWQSLAQLQVENGGESIVTTAPSSSAPIHVVAHLTSDHTSVELTPSGAARPTRFSTLCPIKVAPAVVSSFGVDPSAALARPETAALTCTRPDGSLAQLAAPMTSKLIAYQEEACAPSPGAPAQFELALQVTAAWAKEPLRGQGSFQGESSAPFLRYRVHGKARSDGSLASLLPCAAKDENILVAFEEALSGPAPAASKLTKVIFTFSCQDVQIECIAKR